MTSVLHAVSLPPPPPPPAVFSVLAVTSFSAKPLLYLL